MKPEHISDALGQLSDEILEETDQVRSKPKPARKKWPVWAAAACLCLIAAGALLLPGTRGKAPGDLPLLEVSFEGGGMGFEGLIYHVFSEMNNGNPWREEMELDTLPVFWNQAYDLYDRSAGLTLEEREARARAAAEALGVEVRNIKYDQLQVTEAGESYNVTVYVTAVADGMEIEADSYGTVTVHFDGGLPLPEEYSFTYSDTTDQEAEEVLDYLIDRYAALLNFQQPQKILGGQYDIYAEYNRDYLVYDATGDDVEDILNYSFRLVQFAPDDNGDLMLIRMYDNFACAEKLGDYPLITLDEAREALLAGRYITTVPYDIPSGDYVCGGELVYRSGPWDQTFMPYYRFYVDVSHEFPNWDNGLKNFGAYYVPAVQPQYLKPGWEWDGSFN